ncbi:MAG: DUF4296 domain-containing protein, partial [Bacteroidota bacterium]
MKRLAILVLIATACSPQQIGLSPVDVNSLAPIVADLQLAEAIVGDIPTTVRDSMREVYYNRVMEQHHITSEQFDSLMWIIRKEPAWVAELYQLVNDELAKMEAEQQRTP